MICFGIKLDNVILIVFFLVCVYFGELDKVYSIFDFMVIKYGIEFGVEYYVCMVSVFSCVGKFLDVMEFIFKMLVELIVKVWGVLLNGVYVFGDVEIVRFVYDYLVEMELENIGSYIIMANLYI